MGSRTNLRDPIGELIDRVDMQAMIHSNVQEVKETVQKVRDGASQREIFLLFLLIPVILIGVEGVIRSEFWVLERYNRAYFRFSLTAESFWSLPVLWKAFISSYGHDTLHPHLTGTLFMYYVSLAALYPLSILADRKRDFYVITGFCMLVVPFISSYQSLQNPMGSTTIGFSGVDGAFLGALPVIILSAVRNQTGIEFYPVWTAGPVFVILAGLAYVASASSIVFGLSIGMAVVIGILTTIYLGVGDLIEGLHIMMWPSNIFSWWGVTAAVAGPYLLFFSISHQTNVVGHLAGYFSGYFFALLKVWDMPEINRESLGLR